MASEKRAFVSDLHIGGEYLAAYEGYDFSWLGTAAADDFASFLKHLGSCNEYKELVLLGDVFDDWVWPVDILPPTFDEIIEAPRNQKVVSALRALCKTLRVVYLPGNHDMSVTRPLLARQFPGMLFGGETRFDSVYRTGRLLAEHGSAYAMFNAPDPHNNPGSRLPIGYYISRVVATRKHRTNEGGRRYASYLDDLLAAVGTDTLSSSVFEALLEEAKLSEDVKIKVRQVDGSPAEISAREVKAKYANLFDQWSTSRGNGTAIKAIMCEFGHLGDTADALCRKGGTNIVIFGHSHDWEMDKDTLLVDDRIYANCGSWCDPSKPRTFVETEKTPAERLHTVRVVQWKQNSSVKLAEEAVPL